MKIWISYTFSDKSFIDKLRNALIEQGHQIIELDHSLTAGEYLLEKITKSISEADALLLVISKNYYKSSWMNTEVGLIISEVSTKENKLFIPILIDKGLKLPSYLNQYYYIDYSNGKSFGDNTAQVLKSIYSTNLHKHGPDVHKSIYEALKNQRKMLNVEKLHYQIYKSEKNSFKIFSLLAIISILLTSIIIILFLVKNEQVVLNDRFSIISFIIGVVCTVATTIVIITISKRTNNGRK